MASISTAATVAELVALHTEVGKLEVMLRATVDSLSNPPISGRNTQADIDAQIVKVQAAITAATN